MNDTILIVIAIASYAIGAFLLIRFFQSVHRSDEEIDNMRTSRDSK